MTIARTARNGKRGGATKQMFRPRAHPYTIQIDAKIRRLHVAVTPDFYLVTIGSHSIGLGLAGGHIRVVIDHERTQCFSRQALTDSDRILDYLGLADDRHTRCFERMCADFAEAHGIDASGATERKAAGDLAGFDEWFERNEQRRHRPDADPRDHYSDSGYDLNDPMPAASIAEDIKRMLGQNEPVEEWKPTEADKQRAFKKMIKNQPRQTGIGSMPAAWRTR